MNAHFQIASTLRAPLPKATTSSVMNFTTYVEARDTTVASNTAVIPPNAQPTNGLLTNREKAIGFRGIFSLSCIFGIKNKKGGRERPPVHSWYGNLVRVRV